MSVTAEVDETHSCCFLPFPFAALEARKYDVGNREVCSAYQSVPPHIRTARCQRKLVCAACRKQGRSVAAGMPVPGPRGRRRKTKTPFITSHDRSRAGREGKEGTHLGPSCPRSVRRSCRRCVGELYPGLRLCRRLAGLDAAKVDCVWMCRFRNGRRSTSATRQSSISRRHGVEITRPRDPGTPLFGWPSRA